MGTVPTTGMMVDTDGVTPSMTAVIKKNSRPPVKLLLSSTVTTEEMLPSLQFHALMLSSLLRSSEPNPTQPPLSFLASPLPPPALLLPATTPNQELRLHSRV